MTWVKLHSTIDTEEESMPIYALVDECGHTMIQVVGKKKLRLYKIAFKE